MKNIIGISIVIGMGIAGFVGTVVAIQVTKAPEPIPDETPVKVGGEISGKQYIVLGKGATPVSDNLISFFPCTNYSQCEEEEKASRGTTFIADAKMYPEEKADVILGAFLNISSTYKKVSNSTRTDFDGRFKINCPTEYCFVYSRGRAGATSAYWAGIIKSNTQTDLANSNIIASAND